MSLNYNLGGLTMPATLPFTLNLGPPNPNDPNDPRISTVIVQAARNRENLLRTHAAAIKSAKSSLTKRIKQANDILDLAMAPGTASKLTISL